MMAGLDKLYNPKLKIVAVVVTHNRLLLLHECIDALRKQTRKLDEIIVVNNDSNDAPNINRWYWC